MKNLIIKSIAIGVPLSILLMWGFSPNHKTTVAVRYGNWETQVFLQRSQTDCTFIPDGSGGGYTSCSDSWHTIDQEYESGHCASLVVCDAVIYPTIPSEWYEKSNRPDYEIKSRGRFTITFEDESGNTFQKDYSESEYSVRMPRDLDQWVEVTVNNFGGYNKP